MQSKKEKSFLFNNCNKMYNENIKLNDNNIIV